MNIKKTKRASHFRLPKWLFQVGFLLVLALVLGAHLVTVSQLNEKQHASQNDDDQSPHRIQSISKRWIEHSSKKSAGNGAPHSTHNFVSRTGAVAATNRVQQQQQQQQQQQKYGNSAIGSTNSATNQIQQHTESAAVAVALQEDPHRPCQVLIINQHVEFHYEVLESVLALYPLLPPPNNNWCDFDNLDFTISVSSGSNPHYRRKSDSWNEYAQTTMMQKNYTSTARKTTTTSTNPQIRHLVQIIQTPAPLNDTDVLFDYQISATCYCGPDMNWLFASEKRYCVFHVACRREYLHNNAPHRVQWLHPYFGVEDSFFPNYLPQFERTAAPAALPHRICVIGHVMRRNYNLVRIFLDHQKQESDVTKSSMIELHHFGWGDVPECMKPDYESLMTFHGKPDFIPWQQDLDETCDAILSLLLQQNQTDYFIGGKTKLSGGLVQASAYRKPIVVHEDLAALYQDHLVEVQTHTDDPTTFVAAMDQLLNRLTELKKERRSELAGSGP